MSKVTIFAKAPEHIISAGFIQGDLKEHGAVLIIRPGENLVTVVQSLINVVLELQAGERTVDSSQRLQ